MCYDGHRLQRERYPVTQHDEPRLLGNAAGIAILTIGGMMAGLGFGFIKSRILWSHELLQLSQVVSGGIIGTVIGLGLAILLAARERGSFRSLQKTMVFIAALAVVVWATSTLLRVLFPER
jgi:ABC-type sugar transport system permease subunit